MGKAPPGQGGRGPRPRHSVRAAGPFLCFRPRIQPQLFFRPGGCFGMKLMAILQRNFPLGAASALYS